MTTDPRAILPRRLRYYLQRGERMAFADEHGIDKSQLSRWMTRPGNVTLGSVCKLAEAIGVDAIDLLTEKPNPAPDLIEVPDRRDDYVAVPLLTSPVAAGEALEQLDVFSDDAYVFRLAFLQRVVGSADNALLVRVARGDFGRSMEDTIQRGSLLLVDRRPVTRSTFIDRKIYVVRAGLDDGGATIKRVSIADGHVVCMSDNPEFKPFVLHLRPGEPLAKVIIGRVAWWGTEDRLEVA